MKKRTEKGPEGFEKFYHSMHGERWKNLKEALLKGNQKVHLWNPFCEVSHDSPLNASLVLDQSLRCSLVASGDPEIPPCARGLQTTYQLDLASVLPALALEVQKDERVLDMCSAPGGKALSMVFSVQGDADFVLNDTSLQRVKRLKANLRDYLPNKVSSRVQVTHHDATRWGLYEKESYDRVMLDAPCSGEAHLLVNQKELNQWSKQRTKRLAMRQYALLCAALDAVKPGGRIVYSTCSLSDLENDEVIQKLLKKRMKRVEVRPVTERLESLMELEKSELGYRIWPDRSQGWGPIFFSVLEKRNADEAI